MDAQARRIYRATSQRLDIFSGHKSFNTYTDACPTASTKVVVNAAFISDVRQGNLVGCVCERGRVFFFFLPAFVLCNINYLGCKRGRCVGVVQLSGAKYTLAGNANNRTCRRSDASCSLYVGRLGAIARFGFTVADDDSC